MIKYIFNFHNFNSNNLLKFAKILYEIKYIIKLNF